MAGDLRGRFRGALLGLACGDAMGVPAEGRSPFEVHPLYDLAGGGAHGLLPGQWTDDTSLALCLADSLVACREFDAKDQLERYTRWWRSGERSSTGRAFDIGGTTLRALVRYSDKGTLWADGEGASNGSLMRLAPVPLAFAGRPDEAVCRSGESSQTTHGGREAVDGCRLLGALIALALEGMPKQAMLSPAGAPALVGRPLAPAIREVVEGRYKNRRPPEISAAPTAAATLEAALWAFYHSGTFPGGLFLAVGLGGDADTVGAVYGQLAGAYYGEGEIPQAWRQAVCRFADLSGVADRLLALSRALAR